MQDEMRRGRSQVLWRYAPGATFRYNDGGAWCRSTEITLRNPAPLSGALASAVASALRRWDAIGPHGFPDPEEQGSKYAVGEPYQVMYSVWPTVFTCRDCGQVHFYKDLAKLRQVNDRLSCRTCKGRDQLRQVPYCFVCECGRLEPISMQKHDITHRIELVDKGGFASSFWWCATCRTSLARTSREGLGFRPCSCYPRKAMRGVLMEDSRSYYSQTFAMVDIQPTVLSRWKENVRFSDILLSACLKIPAYKPSDLLDLAQWKPAGTSLSPELRIMRDRLIGSGIAEAKVDEMIRGVSSEAQANPWEPYEGSLATAKTLVGSVDWKSLRRTVEFVFVRDEPGSCTESQEDLLRAASNAKDNASLTRIAAECRLVSGLGISDLRIVQALPILLAGIGYSRHFSTPREGGEGESNSRPPVLQPYASQDGKLPIYTARNTTEALLYELDPCRIAAFLSANGVAEPTPDAMKTETALRAWLLSNNARLASSGESHLELTSFEQEAGLKVDTPSALTFGLLHSLSHVLKATAHLYVGLDADSLAEYLFPAHNAGLLYVASNVEFTLGGIDAVFRANLTQWLTSARDYAGRCSFDPVCSRSGGACLACLYTKFGCAYFNRSVTRAYLFGGEVRGLPRRLQGYWSPQVAAAADVLRSRLASTAGASP